MIRPARYSDFEAIKRIFDVAFDDEYRQRGIDIVKRISRWQQMYPLIRILALFPNPYQYTFNVHVYDDDGIKGLIQTSARNRERTTWHIENVAVLPEARGRGIAKELLDFIFETYSRLGVIRFTLEVDTKNAPAIRLYEKSGFRKYTTVHYFRLQGSQIAASLGEKPVTVPLGFRRRKAADAQGLLELYTACTPAAVRMVDERKTSDFKDHALEEVSGFLKEQLKYCRADHWVVERDGMIVASLEVDAQFRKLPHVVRLMVHPGFGELNEMLLRYVLQHLKQFPPRTVLCAALDHQTGKLDALKHLGFKAVTSDHLMVRDNLQVITLAQVETSAKVREDTAFKPIFAERQ